MDLHPDQQPWTNLRSASTTSLPKEGKIGRPRRAKSRRRQAAAPHRLASRYGLQAPVTLTLRLHQRADLWMEVTTDQGRFFVPFDASIFDLVKQVIQGGHQVEPLTASTAVAHRSGIRHLTTGNGSQIDTTPAGD